MNMLKRFLALLLVACMMLAAAPVSAFAAEGEPTEESTQAAEVEETTAPTTVPETVSTETTEATVSTESTVGTVPEESNPDDETLPEEALFLADGIAVQALTMGEKPADGTTTGNPFSKGTAGSNSFRIPAMVTLNNGTIVAAADARWNTTFDGGGLDTIVSRSSDGGQTWRYTFANYLGDNGNEYNGSGSTAFIDPCLATDGSTVYMLCDLYPYGVALNGSGNTAPSTAVGFNSDGTLKLAKSGSSNYNYYLKDGRIYDSNGSEVSGYTVDEYFNIKDSYGSTSNLFFSNSPYQVVRTGYLYLTSSTDGGATWSAPTLIPNVKTAYEQVCLVGPGRGLVTGGRIIFPVYSYNGSAESQRMGFIYSTNGGASWMRVDSGISWSSEAAVVELDNGTLRFFYRNGTSRLCYVDYNWSTGWDSAVNTGIATNSNTQISAISYSGRVDGKQVILVSCPAGSGSNGSNQSGASYRTNGKIFVGLVNTDNSMDWQTDKTVSLTSQNSSNNFMYSCMTELSDGRVAVLYEDNESDWGAGSRYYYQMTYANIDASAFGLTFDAAAPTTKVFWDDATGVEVTVTAKNGESLDDWTLTVTTNQSVDGVSGSYAAYDISLADASGAKKAVTGASVSLPVGDLDASNAAPFTVSDGTVAELNGTLSEDGKAFTFTADLPGTVGIAVNDMTSPDMITKDIVLTVGDSQTVTDESGDYEDSYTGEGLDATIATVQVTGTTVGGTAATPERKDKVTDLTAGTYIIGNGSQWLTLNGSSLSYTTDPAKATQWTIAQSGSSWTIKSGSNYLSHRNNGLSVRTNTNSATWNYDGNSFYYTTSGYWQTTYYLRWSGSNWQVSTSSSNRGAAYTYTPSTEGTEGKASTEIVFTGVSAGTTSVVVGNTVYNITVNRKALTVNLAVGSTETFQDSGTPMVEDDTIASATLSGGTLAITGLAEGTTTVTTDTAVYTVNVSTATHLTVAQGSSLTISTPLEDGQYVKWSSEDSSYVGVAGVYDATKKAYTNEADVFGQEVTETPIEVTGTIYNSDGSVASVAKWRITVTEPEAGTVPVTRYYDVDHVENCVLYYSINGGRLVQVNGTGVSIIPGVDEPHTIIDGSWHGDMSLMFFAAPNEGYALTHLFVEDSEGQYYVLSDCEDSDVTKSSAWPFREDVDPENLITVGAHTYSIEEVASLYRAGDTSIYRQVNQDSSIWKTIDGSLHGFRWALLEGYVSPTRLKELLTDAHAKGCTGIATVTKGSTNHTYVGTAADPVSICTIAQKLATVDKVVEKLTDADGKDITQDGIVKIGDTVTYKVTVTVPATSEVVKYWDGSKIVSGSTSTVSYTNMTVADSLSDYSPDFNWTQRSVTSSPTAGSDQVYTVTYSVPLTAQNFGDIVTGGTITNVAALSYDYRASLGKGTHKSSAEKQLDVTVEIPSYVVDFGLPVDIDLTGRIPSSGRIITCENGSFGTATVNANGSGLIYTPNAILQGVDYINFTYQRPNGEEVYGYKVAIYPATTVYYEEGFATYSGSWTGYSKGSGTQAAQILGSSADAYGYDQAYSTGLGASGGTRAVSGTVGDSCSFTFTGTGFEIYADCAPGSGYLSSVVVRDENNTAVKAYLVNTVAANGKTDATVDQATDLYGLPIISEQNLTYGTYKITVTHIINQKPIYIDGIRIYGTMGENTAIYQGDGENNPTFIELRDQVLASLGATDEDSQQYADQIASNLHSQVYDINGSTQGAIITSASTDEYTKDVLTDLLDNGPKNEIFLRKNQSLTFAVATSGKIQVGLRAPTVQTSYRIQSDGSSASQTIATSTDMFYTVTTAGTSARHTVTITNTGDGILSVTKLKVCGDSNAVLDTLAGDDLIPAMESLGFARKPDATKPSTPDPVNPSQPEKPDVPKEPETPDVPAQPEQPSVSYADAALTVILVDYTGTTVSTARLTANGEEHKTHSFTAQALRSAAEGAMPSGYAFVEEDAIPSADVNYGEEGTVKIQVGKVAVLNVTYINILGRKIGTATITKVQTSAGSCRISASEIREVALNGRRAIWLTSVKVPFGSERSIIVSTF